MAIVTYYAMMLVAIALVMVLVLCDGNDDVSVIVTTPAMLAVTTITGPES